MSAGALLELVRGSIASMDAATAAANCDALHALFIRALDCRQQRPVSLHNVDVVEGAAVGEYTGLIWIDRCGCPWGLAGGWGHGGLSMCQLLLLVVPCQPAQCYHYCDTLHLVVILCQLLLLVPSRILPAC